jgi:hypothetical protein
MLIRWADRGEEPATTFLEELDAIGLGEALGQVALYNRRINAGASRFLKEIGFA